MSFITGIIAIDATAAALNNGKGENNVGQVKAIRQRQHEYPYVSAQALRYWLRQTITRLDPDWLSAPVYRSGRGKQQAFTEGDPLRYWDDDLFGYMRAEKSEGTFTRIAPFRMGTLVSVSSVEIVQDFGVMGRGEGDYVLHAHEFYKAVLVGGFSIDLSAVGTFTTENHSGQRNLSPALIQQAEADGLEYLPAMKAFRLPLEMRTRRVASLLGALARLEGGAKQTLHYTDVSPTMVTAAVLRGGNNPFIYLLDADPHPKIRESVLKEFNTVYAEEHLSPLYMGLRAGFADHQWAVLKELGITPSHPREALDMLADDLWQNPEWFA